VENDAPDGNPTKQDFHSGLQNPSGFAHFPPAPPPAYQRAGFHLKEAGSLSEEWGAPQTTLKAVLEDEGDKFTVDGLGNAVKDLEQLSDLEKATGEPFLMFLEPPSLDERIINQYALFSLMSNSEVIVYRVSPDRQSKQAVDRRRIKPVERRAATERRKSFSERSWLDGVDPSGLVPWFLQARSSLRLDSRFH